MAVYFKFKSAKDFNSIPVAVPFISVGALKHEIFLKKLGKGKDFDLLVTNAQTNEDYANDETLIPRNSSVIVRRIPGIPCQRIVIKQEQKEENHVVETEKLESSQSEDKSIVTYTEDSDWDEDIYEKAIRAQTSNLISEATPTTKPLLGSDFGTTGGFVRGKCNGIHTGDSRGYGLEWKKPPQGYVCYRCKVPGHLIHHCPTNGDPNYDIQRNRKPTGIPQSMLMENPQGSYASSNGTIAVLKPNKAAFKEEMEGLSSTCSVGDIPPELHCPLCCDVMKDAVLTSKCCFRSFCDKCMRDYIISKSMCICGATNILADDLLPNKTIRDTINRYLESGNSSVGSTSRVQHMESARCKIPSPTSSVASMGKPKVPPPKGGTTNLHDTVKDRKVVSAQQTLEKVMVGKDADISDATHESISQQTLVSSEAGKKRKKRNACSSANDQQGKTSQHFAAENYMFHVGPTAGYNSYWNGMQPGMEGFMAPYAYPVQMMGYCPGPFATPFASLHSHDSSSRHGYMWPVVPPHTHRELSEFSMGTNVSTPITGRGRTKSEAGKSDLRKRENEGQGETKRDITRRDQVLGRDVSSVRDSSSMKSDYVCDFCQLKYSPSSNVLLCPIYILGFFYPEFGQEPQACKRTLFVLDNSTCLYLLNLLNYINHWSYDFASFDDRIPISCGYYRS